MTLLQNNKIVKPLNPLIWNTAADFAAVWFDAALSSGLPRGKYVGRGDKPIKMFVKDHIEKFVPITIRILLDMLKKNSNCTEHMKAEIYQALIDPINDPDLMDRGKSKSKAEHDEVLIRAIRGFEKNKIAPVNTNVLEFKPSAKKDLKSSTALG